MHLIDMKVVIPALGEDKQPDLNQFNSKISDKEQTSHSLRQEWTE